MRNGNFIGLAIIIGLGAVSNLHAGTAYDFFKKKLSIRRVENGSIVPLFYVTNRAEKSSDPLQFGNKISKAITYGDIRVRISDNHKIGFARAHAAMTRLKKFPRKDFVKKLKHVLSESKTKRIVVWAHGYKNSFESAALEGSVVAFDFDFDATYVYFSWPSQDSLLGYGKDRKMADASGLAFAETLQMLVKEVRPKELIIIAHSMGNQLLVKGFSHLSKDPSWMDKEEEIKNIIMVAPDVDHDAFHSQFKKQIELFTTKITVYMSSNDHALLASRIYNGSARLGNSLKQSDGQQEEFSDLMAIEAVDDNDVLDIIDVSLLSMGEILKHDYFRNRSVVQDMVWLLRRSNSAGKRHLLRSKGNGKASYWVAPP